MVWSRDPETGETALKPVAGQQVTTKHHGLSSIRRVSTLTASMPLITSLSPTSLSLQILVADCTALLGGFPTLADLIEHV